MEVSLRMISLPLLSWAVTILRMEGSVVWDWDMVLLDEGEQLGRKRKTGETDPTHLYTLRGGT